MKRFEDPDEFLEGTKTSLTDIAEEAIELATKNAIEKIDNKVRDLLKTTYRKLVFNSMTMPKNYGKPNEDISETELWDVVAFKRKDWDVFRQELQELKKSLGGAKDV